MKKIELHRLSFRLSHVRLSENAVFYSVDFSPATIITAENRAFDLMWISKHHESVFRFTTRLPGLVAMAGCSSLRISRLLTATARHFLCSFIFQDLFSRSFMRPCSSAISALISWGLHWRLHWLIPGQFGFFQCLF